MTINTEIERDQWQDFFTTFSNGNRGRMLSLEVIDSETGGVRAGRQGQLMAVDCDPLGKGNDIVVSTGVDELVHSHTIDAPVEVWQTQDDGGLVCSLEVIDQNNIKTILTLERQPD